MPPQAELMKIRVTIPCGETPIPKEQNLSFCQLHCNENASPGADKASPLSKQCPLLHQIMVAINRCSPKAINMPVNISNEQQQHCIMGMYPVIQGNTCLELMDASELL